MLLLNPALPLLATIASASVVQIDIQRSSISLEHVVRNDRARLSRRQIPQILDNLQTLYFANITLGTPPQRLRMHIDTGSSDLWCNSPQSTLCSSRPRNCEDSGTYDSTASSTYKFLNDNFSIKYVDGTGALGDYVTDAIGVGGQTITNFQFGVGISSTSTEGVLGIGYPINEVQVHVGGEAPYPNLPQLMVDNGLIKANAYSLWLNDLDANTGQILFGGVNTAKYHGSLQTVPILQAAGQYVETLIALSGISVDGIDLQSSSLPAGVLLDSGTTLMYLPNEITRSIYNQVHAVTDTSSGRFTAYVPCALANEDRSLDFTFSGIKISVPYNELALPSENPDGSGLQFDDGTPACVFGIAPSGDSTSVLGDTFLRSAYVVYDLINNQISLASTNFNSTTDSIKEIAPGHAGVPDAAMVPNPVTKAQHIGTGAARLAAVLTPTGTVVHAESAGASAGAKTHVAVWFISPVIVGVILLLWL